MTPTKSQILRANPNKVLDLLDEWLKTAETLEQQAETYTKYIDRPGGTPWEGKTAESAQARARSDYRAIVNVCGSLRTLTGQIRDTITSVLGPPLSNARQIITNADAQPGVAVNEDLSISYSPPAGLTPNAVDTNKKIVAEAAAELKDSAQQWWLAEQQVGQQILDAQTKIMSEVDTFSPTEPAVGPHVQTVDHHWKLDPTPKPLPDPVTQLGLPNYEPGSLSNEEARTVYTRGELNMRELNERLIKQGLSAEERSVILFEQRNSLRTWSRGLMSDRAEAERLFKNEPNMTYDQLIAKNRARGLAGDQLFNAIIDSSVRSRASVNETFGIDPQHPPPLPSIRSSTPVEGAPAAEPRPEPPSGGRGPAPAPPLGGPRITGTGPPPGGGGIVRPFPFPGAEPLE